MDWNYLRRYRGNVGCEQVNNIGVVSYHAVIAGLYTHLHNAVCCQTRKVVQEKEKAVADLQKQLSESKSDFQDQLHQKEQLLNDLKLNLEKVKLPPLHYSLSSNDLSTISRSCLSIQRCCRDHKDNQDTPSLGRRYIPTIYIANHHAIVFK